MLDTLQVEVHEMIHQAAVQETEDPRDRQAGSDTATNRAPTAFPASACHVPQLSIPIEATRPIDCAAVEKNVALAIESVRGLPVESGFEASLKTLTRLWVIDTHGTEGYWGNGEQCLKDAGGRCLLGETFSSGEIDLNLGMAMFVHEFGHPWSLVTSGDPDQDHLHFEERGINAAQRLYESKKVSPSSVGREEGALRGYRVRGEIVGPEPIAEVGLSAAAFVSLYSIPAASMVKMALKASRLESFVH